MLIGINVVGVTAAVPLVAIIVIIDVVIIIVIVLSSFYSVHIIFVHHSHLPRNIGFLCGCVCVCVQFRIIFPSKKR